MSVLDSVTNNDFLRISKSLIPYLDTDKQKAAAIFIKTFELMSTIDLFSREEFLRSITKPRDMGWEKNLLSDIRSNLSDDRAYFIDAILKLSEFRELFAVKNNEAAMTVTPTTPPPSTNSASQTPNNASAVLDKLSGVLEPNQMQLLKILSAFMNK